MEEGRKDRKELFWELSSVIVRPTQWPHYGRLHPLSLSLTLLSQARSAEFSLKNVARGQFLFSPVLRPSPAQKCSNFDASILFDSWPGARARRSIDFSVKPTPNCFGESDCG